MARYGLLYFCYKRELSPTYGDRYYLLLLSSKSREADKLGSVAYLEHTEASNIIDTGISTRTNREEAIRLVGPYIKSKDLFNTHRRYRYISCLGLGLDVVKVYKVSAINCSATLVRPILLISIYRLDLCPINTSSYLRIVKRDVLLLLELDLAEDYNIRTVVFS